MLTIKDLLIMIALFIAVIAMGLIEVKDDEAMEFIIQDDLSDFESFRIIISNDEDGVLYDSEDSSHANDK